MSPLEVVTEPFTIMLWGITSESIGMWLGAGDDADGGLRGLLPRPGWRKARPG